MSPASSVIVMPGPALLLVGFVAVSSSLTAEGDHRDDDRGDEDDYAADHEADPSPALRDRTLGFAPTCARGCRLHG